MKKIYQSPEVHVTEMQMQTMLMMSTSEDIVEGDNGGWVKQDRSSGGWNSSKSVWDDDWSNN